MSSLYIPSLCNCPIHYQLLPQVDIQINRLLVGPACLPTLPIYFTICPPQKWCCLPTHKLKRHWAKKMDQARTNPPPCFLFFVVGGSLLPFFTICGQMVKLRLISSLLTQMSMTLTHGKIAVVKVLVQYPSLPTSMSWDSFIHTVKGKNV